MMPRGVLVNPLKGMVGLLLTAGLAAGPAVAASPEPQRARQALEEVFSRREFSPGKEPLGWLKWLLQWLIPVFSWLGSLYQENPFLFWLLLIGSLLLLVLLLGRLAWAVRGVWVYSSRPHNALEMQRRRLSAGYVEAAGQAAEAGDFTEAVRCLFLSLVYRLDESGRLAFEPALTNHEYLRHFVDRPEVFRSFQVFVQVLDDNWYGQQPTAPEQYQHCRALFQAFEHGS